MSKWEIFKIGDVCKTSSGGTPLKLNNDYYDNGDIPWLVSGEVCQKNILNNKNYITQKGLENSSAKLFPVNTVLVAMYGATAGQVGILRFESATNQAICGILPNKRIIPEFLYYALLFKKSELIAQATGNAQPNISQIKIKNTKIPVPPIEEQKRIVEILDKAFEGIAQAEANTRQNLINVRNLSISHLNKIFREKEATEKICKIEDICEVIAGQSPKGEFYNSKGLGLPFYQGKKEFGKKFISSPQTWTTSVTKVAIAGDILMSIRAPVGPVNFATQKICIGRGLAVIRARESIDKNFLFYYLFYNQDNIKGNEGAVFASINKSQIQNISLPVPPIEEQKRIVEILDKAFEEISKLETIYQRKLEAIAELKQSILEKAFTGQLSQ